MTLLGLNYTLAQFARKLHVFVFVIFEKVSNIKIIFEYLITAWGGGNEDARRLFPWVDFNLGR